MFTSNKQNDSAEEDYYQLLGISSSATDEEVKAAYRSLARQFHPDVRPSDQAADETFKQIGLAYEVLSNSHLRAEYDQQALSRRTLNNDLAPVGKQAPPRTIHATAIQTLIILGRLALILALIVWSFIGLQFDFTHFGTGVRSGADYVGRMFPKKHADWRYDLSALRDLWDPFLTTLQMAIVGTTLGGLLAFPASFVAARTGAIPRPISALLKTYLNVSRAVPTIVYALIVVSAIGLGPSAGAIAISFVTFVSLAKLWAESLESVAAGPIEAVRASGGNAAQVFVFGMLPQVFPAYVSTTLYSLEYNLKDSFIVGIVGAGGLGFQLYNAINLFKLLDAGVIVTLLIILVNLVDYLSYRVRLVFS